MLTLAAVAWAGMALTGMAGSGAIILGGGLALSTTAVGMQVRGGRGWVWVWVGTIILGVALAGAWGLGLSATAAGMQARGASAGRLPGRPSLAT